MSELNIIGVSGKAGAGKDYIGREVLRPAGFRRWAFAIPMKNAGVGAGFTYEEMHDTKPPAAREWLQRHGTEDGWMKHGRLYWCNVAGAYLRTLADEYGVRDFYFTDVRFPHEAEWIRAQGGALVRVEHDDRPYPLAGTPAAAHTSETALDDWQDWDAVIYNGRGTEARHVARALRGAGVLPPLRPSYDPVQLDLFDPAL